MRSRRRQHPINERKVCASRMLNSGNGMYHFFLIKEFFYFLGTHRVALAKHYPITKSYRFGNCFIGRCSDFGLMVDVLHIQVVIERSHKSKRNAQHEEAFRHGQSFASIRSKLSMERWKTSTIIPDFPDGALLLLSGDFRQTACLTACLKQSFH